MQKSLDDKSIQLIVKNTFGIISPMKTNIAIEAEDFLASTGFSARKLAMEAGVNPVILTRVLSGTRKDMKSENADRLRAAMKRLSHQSKAVPSEGKDTSEAEVSSPHDSENFPAVCPHFQAM